MEKWEPIFKINLAGKSYSITSSIITQWVIIVLLILISYLLTRNLNKIPDKRQSALEIVIEKVNNLVKENMGESYVNFIPYIGSLFIFILILNLSGLIGVRSPSEDISVPAGLAAITFFMVQATAIKRNGFKKYLVGYTKPMFFILPMNILEKFTLPLSLCLRLFGNMTAGGVIIGMIYKAMGHYALIVPIPVHFYFDLFDGTIQTVIFVMLTMINIKILAEE